MAELPLSHINERLSSTEKKFKPAEVEIPPRKYRASNQRIEMASVPSAIPSRGFVFDALSKETIPLAKNEQRPNYPGFPA